MVFGGRDNHEGLHGLVLWCGGCALRGPDTGDRSDIPRHVILDVKRQWKGAGGPGRDYLPGPAFRQASSIGTSGL